MRYIGGMIGDALRVVDKRCFRLLPTIPENLPKSPPCSSWPEWISESVFINWKLASSGCLVLQPWFCYHLHFCWGRICMLQLFLVGDIFNCHCKECLRGEVVLAISWLSKPVVFFPQTFETASLINISFWQPPLLPTYISNYVFDFDPLDPPTCRFACNSFTFPGDLALCSWSALKSGHSIPLILGGGSFRKV